MSRKGYTPTDIEREEICRAGMIAALAELKELKEHGEYISLGVLTCLRAFKAARESVIKSESMLLLNKKGYDYVSFFVETTDLVCSAMYAMLIGLDPQECSPESVGGNMIAMLMKSAKALNAMSDVYSAFDDDSAVFGTYLADEATRLAEAAIFARHGNK